MTNTSGPRDERNRNTANKSVEMKSRNSYKRANSQQEKRQAKDKENHNPSSSRITFDSASIDSDVSADEADVPQQQVKRLRSSVHEYADKLSAHEYRCNVCLKVSSVLISMWKSVFLY